MRRYLKIAVYNLRFNLSAYIAAALGVLALTPVLFSVTALDSMTAALPLELALPFVGVAALTPIYSPEQESGLRSVIASRQTPYIAICLIRVLLSLLTIFICINGFVFAMALLESDVTFVHGLASCSNAIFLGGLGILASALSANIIIGYMLPLLYYVLDLMGGMTPIPLFSMMRTGSMEGKPLLYGIGMLCIAVSLFMRYIQMKRQ